ncbi:hypothetical protein [Streptacidiphilus monticola]|uniref:Uncharacterized protein n=1 Tax=Streptacidiphilus monticola TaxID=2161674 RepID=A0ABW1G956_9ACTN
MSDTIGDPATTTSPRPQKRVGETAHEAYSFVCLHCGFGWEQAYEIEHVRDAGGRLVYLYRANGVPVPSPLTKPSCPGCGEDRIRIMRAGRVSEVDRAWHAAQSAAPGAEAGTAHGRHFHWPWPFSHRTTPEA